MKKVTTKPEAEKKTVKKSVAAKKTSVKDEKKVTKTRPIKPAKNEKPIELPTMSSFPTVKKGDHNGYVTLLQTNLKNRNFYDGKVDGKFGEKTEQAVLDFQKALGKPLNGSVGPKTWEALQKSTVVKASELQAPKAGIVPAEPVKPAAPAPLQGTRVLIEGLSRYQAELLVKLLQGHTECRIL